MLFTQRKSERKESQRSSHFFYRSIIHQPTLNHALFILELNKFSRKRNRRKSKREENRGLNTIRRLIDNWSNLNGHAWNINTISTQSN